MKNGSSPQRRKGAEKHSELNTGAQQSARPAWRRPDIRRSDWWFAPWREVQWVRQVRHRGCLLGIGFLNDQLIQFLGDEANAFGLARQVSPRESVWLLGNIAGVEDRELPDIESNSVAWWKWLRLLHRS